MREIVKVEFDTRGIAPLAPGKLDRAIANALRKAGITALRDMKSEASKRIRARKRLRVRAVNDAIVLRQPKSTGIAGEFGLALTGKPVKLIEYPHRQTQKGVSVEVNVGKRTVLHHAFIATSNGRVGIFQRVGTARLPIRELMGSRPVDALLHQGEADGVAQRGARSMTATFERLLPLEIDKGKK